MDGGIDLLIRAGRVICPVSGLDGPGFVAVKDGRVAAVGAGPAGPARQTLEFADAVLLPGLVDLHGHPSRRASTYGVDPDASFLARGTTTVLAQGEAGADGCEDYVRETVERSSTRVLLAINLARVGESVAEGSFSRLEFADVAACVGAIRRFGAHIWGISINVGHYACGATDPREVLQRGLEAAEKMGRPILYGLRRPEDWPLEEQLRLLRAGDVVTYCYRRTPHCLLDGARVQPCFHTARERGVKFDLGHGVGSFDFDVAETALRDGFPPDTISTDLHNGHLGHKPVHDLPLVMSKMKAAGMRERDVFAAATSVPAGILGLTPESGGLRVGAQADLVLLKWDERAGPLKDTAGRERHGGRWQAAATVRSGQVTSGAGWAGTPDP
jgi:dihydroorotase